MQRRSDIGLKWLAYLVLALLASGCTATSFLKEGDTFYRKTIIDFETQGRVGRKKSIRRDLETYIVPKPNKRFLGMRPGVWFYYIAGTPKKERGLKSFIRNKLGTPPVLMKDVDPENTARQLAIRLNNEGYFKSTVASSVKTRGKNSDVIYTVQLTKPFLLREIRYPKGRDSTYAVVLRTLSEKSLLKPKQRYQLDLLKAEQERIEEVVENFGFYYFDDRYLIFEADSTVGNHQVDLDLKLEKGLPRRVRKIFRINEVKVYPNYTLSYDTLLKKTEVEVTRVDSFTYIDDAHFFKPRAITKVINIKEGNVYTRKAQEYTQSHLMALGTFKFVSIKFEEDTAQAPLLNASIYLTPLKKKSIRFEVQAVSKSNNFAGPGISLAFTNRNFFKGAELFQLKLSSSYEVQLTRKVENPLNSFELGLESSLTVPRFMTPFNVDYTSVKYIPKTEFKVGFNLQNRVGYFRLNSFNVGYGYIWRETTHRTHELYPVDVNFVRTDKKSDEFNDLLLGNPTLESSFENQFIIGTRYSFTLNTQLKEDLVTRFQSNKIKEHNFYFNGNVDLAGNVIHAIQSVGKNEENDPKEVFGSPYSQFIRGDVDFRYYWQTHEHHRIAARIIVGTGYAFGNSSTLPYIKQFSIGGSNSIRAFPARSIGPGTYNIREDSLYNSGTMFIDQRADIKLEGNLEFRFDMIKSLKGAVFVDAGNIWLIRNDDQRPGGKFEWNQFMKELAVGTGFGLRFDFSFFVLRADLAFPLRKPYLIDRNPWVFDEIDFSDSTWRKENLVLNIAIGYPF
ncbi:MAG TPA: BamA/TamA family outer membrane protein [Ohtaekwangia sp.]